MLLKVILRAADIQVTASNEADAERYAREDALEFIHQWNYDLDDVQQAGGADEPTRRAEDVEIDVECVRPGGKRGSSLWTFDATMAILVEADEAGAEAAARARVAAFA